MDIEFHYYITYLVAARAGYSPRDAETIAYASQYTDDNDIIFEIDAKSKEHYSNYISQTINIFNPRLRLLRIYPLFHFIPGDPMTDSARRKDGKLHYLNTTADSQGARDVLAAALDSNNLYRIGIACHAYADTWAHQNFVGYFDEMNVLKGVLQRTKSARIGHAGAGHWPDRTAAVWEDCRLVTPHARRENKALFLQAVGRLFVHLRRHLVPACSEDDIIGDRDALVRDIDEAIGLVDLDNSEFVKRVKRYQQLASGSDYGNTGLAEYNADKWFDEAISEITGIFRIRDKWVLWRSLKNLIAERVAFVRDIYSWRNLETYQDTHWYKFQEAVKAHQAAALSILDVTTFKKMELERW